MGSEGVWFTNILGGLGGAVAEVISETCAAVLSRIGLNDRFAESGDEFELLDKYGMSPETIMDKVKALIKQK